MRTYCTCGVRHEFDGAANPPHTISCDICPICSGGMAEDDDFSIYNFDKSWNEQEIEDDIIDDNKFYKGDIDEEILNGDLTLEDEEEEEI